jgi:hypothetical protein
MANRCSVPLKVESCGRGNLSFEDHAALLNAVRHADILLFNCWYHSDEAKKIKKLYEEATR